MRIFEAEGRLVRDPATLQRLGPDGLEVPDGDVHWARMIADGDVRCGRSVEGALVIDAPLAGAGDGVQLAGPTAESGDPLPYVRDTTSTPKKGPR